MARKETKTQAIDLGFPNNDVILVVEGQKIHVNKAVLSEHSPVFNVMFKSKFKESTAKEIVLHDKKAVDVVEFLRSFYPNMKHPITGANVLRVLPLAHEYQSSLVTDCENFMIAMCKPDKGLTVSILLDYILAGEKYSLARFLETAVEFCSKVDSDLLKGETFHRSIYFTTNGSGFDKRGDKQISLKFSKIEMKTQYAILMKRVQHLEMNRRKQKNLLTVENDYEIPLS